MSTSIAIQMQQLYQQFGHLTGISIELHKHLIAIRVENSQATATVFLQGAQLTHYQLHQQQPIIWCSPLCHYQQGQPLRGGIPVCWPWFGDLSQNPDAVKQSAGQISNIKAHGIVRDMLWQLDSIEIINNELTQLQLVLNLPQNSSPQWPYACQLQLTVDVGKQLAITLTVENQDTTPFAYASALHSYFAVSDIKNVTVDGLENLHYLDSTQNQQHKQAASLIIDKEIDRIYQGTSGDIRIIDSAWHREICIQTKGSNSTVVWNPWQDKSKTLSQFDENAYKTMLCVESANVAQDYVEIASGERYQMDVVISQKMTR